MAKSKRRWVQFSLRTVLLLVTLLCVALSVWVVPAERQRRAVQAIEALGGSVEYAGPDPFSTEVFPKPLLRRYLPPDYFDDVDVVSLNASRITDKDLAYLQKMTSLQKLFLDDTQITDSGLAHLEGLKGLQRLNLIGTKITDSGLVRLKGMTNMEWLAVDNTRVADAGLVHLQAMTDLKVLSLNKTRVTDAGLSHLYGLTHLRWLGASRTQVTDIGVTQLHQELPSCRVFGP